MDFQNFTINLAEKAGKIILKYYKNGFNMEEKSERDFVTDADKESEKFIISSIKKTYKDHGFLAEENEFKKTSTLKKLIQSPYIWIIDPLDGTNNFTHGLPNCTVSIALFKTQKTASSKNFKYLSGEIILGVVYQPFTKEMFYAEKNKGAFLNSEKITVSKIAEIKDAMIGLESPINQFERNLDAYTALIEQCHGIRQIGSAAQNLAYLACGRTDAFISFGLKPWDIAAGILLIKEAGGEISDSNGNLIDLFGQDLLASNKHLHETILNTLGK
jgi:myo-inositol-1(or 4)-monophosphatase